MIIRKYFGNQQMKEVTSRLEKIKPLQRKKQTMNATASTAYREKIRRSKIGVKCTRERGLRNSCGRRKQLQ